MEIINFENISSSPIMWYNTPQVVDFWVSGICNMRCRYCLHSLPRDAAPRKGIIPSQLSWEDFLRVAEDMKRFPKPVQAADFCGIGEPLTHPRLPDMIEYLKKNQIVSAVELSTNGLLLTEEMARRLIDAGVDLLSVSIQGVNRETYESVCGVAADPLRIAESVAWYRAHKKPGMFVIARTLDIALPGEGDEARFHEIFDPVADQTFAAHAVRLYQDMDYSELIPDPVDQFRGGEIVHAPCCPLVFSTLHIRPDGGIAACPLPLCPLHMGNIREVSLQEAWNSKARLQLITDHAECARERYGACVNCTQPDMLCRDTRPSEALAVFLRAKLEQARKNEGK